MLEVSKEGFEAWRSDPVTEEYFRELNRMADEESRRIGGGATLNAESAEETLAMTSKAVGYVKGLRAAAGILPKGRDE